MLFYSGIEVGGFVLWEDAGADVNDVAAGEVGAENRYQHGGMGMSRKPLELFGDLNAYFPAEINPIDGGRG